MYRVTKNNENLCKRMDYVLGTVWLRLSKNVDLYTGIENYFLIFKICAFQYLAQGDTDLEN